MKPASLAIIALAVLFGACASGPVSAPLTGATSAAAPNVRAGDSWTFRELNGYNNLPKGTLRERVLESGASGIRVEVSADDSPPGPPEAYTPDWGWRDKLDATGVMRRFKPAFPAYVFPLAVGQKWGSEVDTFDPASGAAVAVKIRARVLGWELVRVPAGDFEALKVRRESWYSDGGTTHFGTYLVETDWYAPKVNHFVRHEDSFSQVSKTQTFRRSAVVYQSDWRVFELSAYTREGKTD